MVSLSTLRKNVIAAIKKPWVKSEIGSFDSFSIFPHLHLLLYTSFAFSRSLNF